MKTPEEIKKGLEMCSVIRGRCKGCPYDGEAECVSNHSADALAYIQQLEDHIGELTEKVAQLEAALPKWISVEERLPEKREIVVVTDGTHAWDYGEFMGLAFCFDNDNPNRRKWNWKKHTVKHVEWWMPKKTALPEAPKEG